MGKRKHGHKAEDTRVIQAKQEEEQQLDKKPSEALSRLSGNVAQPEDIQALQRTLGNRAVTGLIQRHPEDTGRIIGNKIMTDIRLSALQDQVSQNRDGHENLKDSTNRNLDLFHGSITRNRDGHENLKNATNRNLDLFHGSITRNKDTLGQHGARISSLESSGGGGGGGEEVVVPAAGGI